MCSPSRLTGGRATAVGWSTRRRRTSGRATPTWRSFSASRSSRTSTHVERNRNGYYKLLLAVTERGAWSEWVIFFLRGVEEQARDAVARAKQLQDLERHWRHQMAKTRSS